MVVDNSQENKTSETVQVDKGDTNGFDSRLDEILKRFDYERDYREAEQSILDWHNKQIEAMIKRLNDLWTTIMIDEACSEKAFAYREAIEAQLKERESLPRIKRVENIK